EGVRSVAGHGVQGTVNGRTFALGSSRWMKALGMKVDEGENRGHTISWLADVTEAPRLLARMAVGDEPRPEAAEAVKRLAARGVRSVMVSGDNAAAANAIARRLGIDEVRAEVLPADKAEIILELRKGD